MFLIHKHIVLIFIYLLSFGKSELRKRKIIQGISEEWFNIFWLPSKTKTLLNLIILGTWSWVVSEETDM